MRMIFALVLALGYPLLAYWQIHRGKLRYRLDVILALAVGFLFLLFARTTVDWQTVPPWLWLIGLLVLAAGVVRAGWVWPDLRWTNSRRRGRHATWAAIPLAIAAALIVVLL